MSKKIKPETAIDRYSGGEAKQYRSAAFERQTIDEESRTAWLAFSSEEEYERSFGIEILDHGAGSIRMDRMLSGAALLHNHDWDDQIGAVREVEIGDDRMGRARVQFSRSARAEEIWQDVLDGIRTQVSVGYFVHKMQLDREVENGPDVYRVTDWEPFEVSMVSVPADITVGVGRSADFDTQDCVHNTQDEPTKEDNNMSENTTNVPEVDVKAIEAEATEKARKAEDNRQREIAKIGAKYGVSDLADEFRSSGKSVDEFRMAVLEKMGDVQRVDTSPDIGLTPKEAKSFSFMKAIRAMANPGDARLQEEAAFEKEVGRAAEKQTGRTARGILVPNDVLTRDMTVGTDSAGGYLVGTDHMAGSFIELLRNKMMVNQMGATEIRGLVGDFAVPTQSAASTAYWVAESGAVTESAVTVGQKSASPKTIGALTDLSRKLLLQSSPDAEMLVRDDLARVLAIGIDLAALHGTGTNNQPTGLAAAGIDTTSAVGGTNGLAPAWSHIVALETAVAQDNADIGRLGYLTNAKVRGKLRQVFKNATYGLDPIWADGNEPGMGMVNGYRAGVSNQVASDLDKGSSEGVCSAIFFGNWADLVLCYWSGIDLTVDPYTGSSSGTLRVVAFQDMDIVIRHLESFSAMLDALTT